MTQVPMKGRMLSSVDMDELHLRVTSQIKGLNEQISAARLDIFKGMPLKLSDLLLELDIVRYISVTFFVLEGVFFFFC